MSPARRETTTRVPVRMWDPDAVANGVILSCHCRTQSDAASRNSRWAATSIPTPECPTCSTSADYMTDIGQPPGRADADHLVYAVTIPPIYLRHAAAASFASGSAAGERKCSSAQMPLGASRAPSLRARQPVAERPCSTIAGDIVEAPRWPPRRLSAISTPIALHRPWLRRKPRPSSGRSGPRLLRLLQLDARLCRAAASSNVVAPRHARTSRSGVTPIRVDRRCDRRRRCAPMREQAGGGNGSTDAAQRRARAAPRRRGRITAACASAGHLMAAEPPVLGCVVSAMPSPISAPPSKRQMHREISQPRSQPAKRRVVLPRHVRR